MSLACYRRQIASCFALALVPLLIAGDAIGYASEPSADLFLVIQVIDGDTIFLENGESVRYLGIDAPETHHPVRGAECYGPEATERNSQLVEGKYVRLEEDQTDRDAYGRLLRYVFIGEIFVNAVLVQEGFAYSSYFPPDTKHYEHLLALELEAEESGRGLWSACQPFK